MNYHNITKCDMLNGAGLRVVLWVSGCSHHCNGCHNPETWDYLSGIAFDNEAEEELFNALECDYIKGITFSGGDPLHKNNIDVILNLAKKIKTKYNNKDIWLYTGYLYEEIQSLEIIKYIDVLVDGKFVKEQADTKINWRGSTNQRIIDLNKTREKNEIVLIDEIR